MTPLNDRPLRPWQVLAVSLILAASAHARVPQPSASPAGIVKIPMHFRADTPKIELSPEGRLIVSATVSDQPPGGALFRFTTQGKLDPLFGQGGQVLIRRDGAIPLHALVTQALTVQPDGKIVVAGEAYLDPASGADFVLMRFLPDGRLDTSLANRGWTTTRFGKSIDQADGVTVQADAKTVVVGGSLQKSLLSGRYDFAIARYLPDGRLDPQFGQGGKTIVRLGSASEDLARAVQQDQAGRILIAGRAFASQASSAIGVVRLDGRGRLDTTFGRGGKVLTVPGGESAADSLAIQPDQRIVVAGTLYQRDAGTLRGAGVVVRYTDAGSPDPSFGTAGIVRLPDVSELKVVKLQQDGKMLLLGTRETTRQAWAAMVVTRLHPDGSLDRSFGKGGMASVELQGHLTASGMTVSRRNDIYVAGIAGHRFQRPTETLDNGLLLFKLDASGRIDQTFGH